MKTIKLTQGQQFGRWTVLSRAATRLMGGKSVSYWICQCKCGTLKEVKQSGLLANETRSCGCLQRESASRQFKDITGQRFGRLIVIQRSERKSCREWLWECVCDCGNVIETAGSRLRNATSRSCGCLQKEWASNFAKHLIAENITHGLSSTPEYAAYANAKDRCINSNNQSWKDYGGRGIEFRFASFEQFIAHIGRKPSSDFSLDRIDNDSHYMIGNVQWSTESQQKWNRRIPKRRQSGFSSVSGLKGVTPKGRQWQVAICFDGELKYLGSFNSKIEAARKYDATVIEHFGPAACTNESLGLLPARVVA